MEDRQDRSQVRHATWPTVQPGSAASRHVFSHTARAFSPRNEDEMYKILLNDYEYRQKQILMENAELKKVLQQMKKEMISLLSPQKKKPRERAEDSTGTVVSVLSNNPGCGPHTQTWLRDSHRA